MEIVRFDRAGKTYELEGVKVPALHDVSLQINQGEFVALVGRSGCGKSTLLNLAGAMDFPTSGSVWIGGANTLTLSDARLTQLRRDAIGFIFQAFQLLPTLSVIENVELPPMLAGRINARARALEALSWVEMEDYASRIPYQLSGGQMQRVAIARALSNSPSLLLADEPTGNLDSATGETILALLRKIVNEKRATVMVATHSREAAAQADLIVELSDGRVQDVLQQSGAALKDRL